MESHMSQLNNPDNNPENNKLSDDLNIMKAKKDTLETKIKDILTSYNHISDINEEELDKLVAEYDELESKINQQEKQTNIDTALEIMTPEQFIGPDDIEKTFGFKPNEIPSINFSKQELETAQKLGQQLILYIESTNDGTSLNAQTIKSLIKHKTKLNNPVIYTEDWYEKNPKTKDITPRLGWRLTTPEIIDNSREQNYLEQTETLITYLTDKVYKDQEIPLKYQDAINQFESQKTELSALIQSDGKSASEKLSKLEINQLTRENYTEIIYRLTLTENKTGFQNLENTRSWSNSLVSDRRLVDVGAFVSVGLLVGCWSPDARNGEIGVCFSQ